MFVNREDSKPSVNKVIDHGWCVSWWFGEIGTWYHIPFGHGIDNWERALREACLVAFLQERTSDDYAAQ